MKKLLIVVDMQKDFIDGSLGTPEASPWIPTRRIILILRRGKSFRSFIVSGEQPDGSLIIL